MGVWMDSGIEFPLPSPHLSLLSVVLPKSEKPIARAQRRGVRARDHASAYQKEFALEQALRKAKTPKRPFV